MGRTGSSVWNLGDTCREDNMNLELYLTPLPTVEFCMVYGVGVLVSNMKFHNKHDHIYLMKTDTSDNVGWYTQKRRLLLEWKLHYQMRVRQEFDTS